MRPEITQMYFPFINQKWKSIKCSDGTEQFSARDTSRLFDGFAVLFVWALLAAHLASLVLITAWPVITNALTIFSLVFLVWLFGLRCKLTIGAQGITFSRFWYFFRTFEISFPLETEFAVHDVWEDDIPSGVRFNIQNVGELILGSSRDYDILFSEIKASIERCKILAPANSL